MIPSFSKPQTSKTFKDIKIQNMFSEVKNLLSSYYKEFLYDKINPFLLKVIKNLNKSYNTSLAYQLRQLADKYDKDLYKE